VNQEKNMFGKKLKDCSHHLVLKQLPNLENTSPVNDDQETFGWRNELYHFLGDALCEDIEKARTNITAWADIFNFPNNQPEISLNYSLNSVFHARTAILKLLDKEISHNHISAKTVLEIIKVVDPLLDHASNSLTGHYTKYLFNTKFPLPEGNEDLIITLKELMDIKVALNEATIFAITDKNNLLTYVNHHFCEISKYSRDELIGKDHGVIFWSGYHSEEFIQEIWLSIQQGKVWKGEICNKAKDGSLYWVDTTIVPFIDTEGKAYQHISIQYDITEKKRTEEMLLKSEKLSVVGELAAGLAHEVRNPLTTVKGLVQILNHSTEDKKRLYTDIILKEIDRINFIVSEFMVLAKPHAVYFSKCNVIEILKNVIYLLEAEANLKSVVIQNELLNEDVLLYGEKNQLAQVFLNLFKNAMEALPNGGVIRISTKMSDDKIHIAFEDNGIGMTEEQVKRIGEPFYTTKETGTGLGLMVSYKIIENHKGTITVESTLNKGTAFTITLPILRNEMRNENVTFSDQL
jgi:PAS domain S-box-containing protein